MYIQTFQDKLGLSVEYLDYLQMIVWKLLEHNNLPNVRQYHEIFILYILRNFPERVVPQMQKYLQNKTNKTQFLISVAWVSLFLQTILFYRYLLAYRILYQCRC